MLWIENKIGVAGLRGRLRNHKELLKKAMGKMNEKNELKKFSSI